MDDQYLDDQLLPSDKPEEGLDGELSFGDDELKKPPVEKPIDEEMDAEDEILSLDDVAEKENDDDEDDDEEDE